MERKALPPPGQRLLLFLLKRREKGVAFCSFCQYNGNSSQAMFQRHFPVGFRMDVRKMIMVAVLTLIEYTTWALWKGS